jgi:hypothetical protein
LKGFWGRQRWSFGQAVNGLTLLPEKFKINFISIGVYLNRHNLAAPDTFKAITMTPNLILSETVTPFIEVIRQEELIPKPYDRDSF